MMRRSLAYLVQLEEYARCRLVKVVFVGRRALVPERRVHVARLAFRGALAEAAVLTVLGVRFVVVHCGRKGGRREGFVAS